MQNEASGASRYLGSTEVDVFNKISKTPQPLHSLDKALDQTIKQKSAGILTV